MQQHWDCGTFASYISVVRWRTTQLSSHLRFASPHFSDEFNAYVFFFFVFFSFQAPTNVKFIFQIWNQSNDVTIILMNQSWSAGAAQIKSKSANDQFNASSHDYAALKPNTSQLVSTLPQPPPQSFTESEGMQLWARGPAAGCIWVRQWRRTTYKYFFGSMYT